MRIRPPARDQLAVPAQKRCRRDAQRSPPRLPRQPTAERRKQCPISLRQLRTSDVTLQDPQLMAQQHDLDLLLPLRTTPEHGQLEQPTQRPIHQREPCRENDPSPPLTLPITPPTRRRPRGRIAESELPAHTGKRPESKTFPSEAGATRGAKFGSRRQRCKRKARVCGPFAVAGAGCGHISPTISSTALRRFGAWTPGESFASASFGRARRRAARAD